MQQGDFDVSEIGPGPDGPTGPGETEPVGLPDETSWEQLGTS